MEEIQLSAPCREDLPAIAEIEKNFPSPWNTSLLEAEFLHQQGFLLVARRQNSTIIAGWCCVRLIPPEAELLKIAVVPALQRKGIAARMLNNIFLQCRAHQCDTLFLEVRGQNLPAIALYSAEGFQQIARRKGYYTSPADDAVIMKKQMSS